MRWVTCIVFAFAFHKNTTVTFTLYSISLYVSRNKGASEGREVAGLLKGEGEVRICSQNEKDALKYPETHTPPPPLHPSLTIEAETMLDGGVERGRRRKRQRERLQGGPHYTH